ncbi:methyl-accepting chemotaxis protein [Phenylobacterium sp.]|uniref:methyl-accepting chemotaxis protein n=1 Tax=Phenylobacterium sp. TaxID=1871053 RepID=UPI002730BC7F|nr:methyl-accepting chemotaxis protein [Phenylobacterium sp.]MDP1619109.1 methyl-accepting chemotaxis protein [Phenylobacterium sp.]MDP1987938.1 methyl-accepting chemotaxis protein [Phenylobacterium sp.]
MSIANRILLGFVAVIILVIALGAFGLSQIGEVRSETTWVLNRDLAFIRQLSAVQNAQNGLEAATESDFAAHAMGTIETGADGVSLAWRAADAAAIQSLDQAITQATNYQATAVSQERAQAWGEIAQTLTRARAILGDLRQRDLVAFQAMVRGDMAAAQAARAGLVAPRSAFQGEMDKVNTTMDRAMNLGRARIDRVYQISRISTLIGLILAVAIAMGVAYLIRKSIITPLTTFMAFVERVGQGDLTRHTELTGADEIGRLGITLNGMVDGLRDLARQNREATENLNAATAEIRASSQEQAASVEEQLAAVQETAATVDEITHSGAQIGKRAQEVILSAQATAQTSNEGLRAVDETARAMDAIRDQAEAVAENIVALSEKTQAIGDIISTVNDISERSHLLALNAAIEAAAAGESGRSFSVVASEMKLLADQAKDATNQVRSILGDIQRGINSSVMLTEEAVKRVAAGKERTDTTQRTITEITGRVQESVQTFQQIVASTNQQQLGIEQVMGALQNIRQASQQTAVGTRQLEEAAGNLATLSQQLLGLAERYRV